MKNGFTLIELLVVVLIIGILAGVALPQYEKVVAKSRAAEAVVVLNAIVNVENIFYLATGNYTTDLSELDIEIANGSNFTYTAANNNADGSLGGYYRATAYSARYGLFFEFALNSNSR